MAANPLWFTCDPFMIHWLSRAFKDALYGIRLIPKCYYITRVLYPSAMLPKLKKLRKHVKSFAYYSPEPIRHSESASSLSVSKSFRSLLSGRVRHLRSFCSRCSQSMQADGLSASKIHTLSPQITRNELHELAPLVDWPVWLAASTMLCSSSGQLIVSTERWMSIESSGILSVACLKHSSLSVCGLNQIQRFLKPPKGRKKISFSCVFRWKRWQIKDLRAS